MPVGDSRKPAQVGGSPEWAPQLGVRPGWGAHSHTRQRLLLPGATRGGRCCLGPNPGWKGEELLIPAASRSGGPRANRGLAAGGLL